MKLHGSGSNIRPLWLKLEQGGDGMGTGYGQVGGGGRGMREVSLPDRQLLHRQRGPPSVAGGGVD